MYYVSIRVRMQCASESCSIGLPVISFQVNRSGCLHQKMLHIPPGQQKAGETKDNVHLSWSNRALFVWWAFNWNESENDFVQPGLQCFFVNCFCQLQHLHWIHTCRYKEEEAAQPSLLTEARKDQPVHMLSLLLTNPLKKHQNRK